MSPRAGRSRLRHVRHESENTTARDQKKYHPKAIVATSASATRMMVRALTFLRLPLG
jgi:hypothetical protein